MIFINFKTYEAGTGAKAAGLVRILSKCEAQSGITIIPVVQAVDIRLCADFTKELWIQHVDGVVHGKYTGWTLPEAVFESGARGAFVNHSEKKEDMANIVAILARCHEVGLKTMAFAQDMGELTHIVQLKPTYIAYEPPELIASPDTSVAKAKPEVISEAVKIAQGAGVPLVVGAGVKDSEDVRVSLRLGAKGIAVSSAVMLSENPKEVVMELAEGFK